MKIFGFITRAFGSKKNPILIAPNERKDSLDCYGECQRCHNFTKETHDVGWNPGYIFCNFCWKEFQLFMHIEVKNEEN